MEESIRELLTLIMDYTSLIEETQVKLKAALRDVLELVEG